MKTGLIEMISVAIEDGKVLTEKGMNPGFKAYLEKKKGKKGGDDEGKSSKGGGKLDFLDLDKDGDKKEVYEEESKEMKKEEYVTELSKKTLGSYVKKSRMIVDHSIMVKVRNDQYEPDMIMRRRLINSSTDRKELAKQVR